jgi:hypothetical protein
MQGNLFSLLQADNESITWKSYMWDVPHSVLKFAVNSSIDMLSTLTNLRRWGKCASVNCQLCGNMVRQTLFHVMVHCKHTLDQGRLTWRHNSILNHIAHCLKFALVYCTVIWLDCRPRVAGRSRLTSWCRHRDRTLSSLIGQCMVGIG